MIFSDTPGQPADLRLRERDLRMSADRTAAPFSIETRDLNLWYGDFQALKDVDLDIRHGLITGADRTVRLRQDHAAALLQPHQRALRQRHARPARSAFSGKNIYDAGRLADRAAQDRRHGVPAAQSAADLDLRERGLRPAHPQRARARSKTAELDDAVEKALREVVALGRPEGPAARARHDAAARAAAEALHRPAAAAEARGHPDGRAVLGPRRRSARAASRS